jgi:4-amino-4-deoxy-L-arabinose transferase-like glycosyltransferase
MQQQFLEKMKKVSRAQWILLGLIAVGIFLRTYHFSQLLVFASDQARDFGIVKNVLSGNSSWPLLGADMTGGRGFRLGPIYYYFQLLSALLFGVSAVSQAYPDLLFAILSIPLLYYFLKRYFSENTTLALTAVYVFSYFSIEYARFAWNVNLIPFFVLLLLISLNEFLVGEEKTAWKWIVGAGVALGVGIQLHAILLLLFPTLAFCGFVFLLRRNRKVWKKIVAIILLALVLNLPQFVSEQQTGFANTKTFFGAFFFKSQRSGGTVFRGLILDVACNAQANTHILSSLGNKNICNFLYSIQETSTTYNTKIKLEKDPLSLFGKFVSLLFSALGLWLLARNFFKDDLRRKYFSGLVLFYSALYFLIMIPIAPGSRLRYFLPIIFLPFVFLGLFFEFWVKKYPKNYAWLVGAVLVFLLAANLNSMWLKLKDSSCTKETQANFGCNLPLDGAGAKIRVRK